MLNDVDLIRQSLDPLEDYIEVRTRNRLKELKLDPPFPVLPAEEGFRLIESHFLARVWRIQQYRYRGLLIFADVSVKDDNLLWLHVSFSRKNEIPDYYDQVFVKDRIIGKDKWAIAVFPEEAKHVNIHPNCLHLWHCLEGRPFPEFSKNGSI